jgi:hypothetical protein
MRRSVSMLLGSALIATPLVALSTAAEAATVSIAAPAPAIRVLRPDDPYSKFKVSVKWTRATKRGGKITYKVRAKNLGPWDADYFWIGGQVPKGVVPTLHWGAAKGTKCTWEGRWFWCWGKYVLDKGDTEWLDFQVTLKKGTRGVAAAKLGVVAYDMPQGAGNIDEGELDRLGIPGWKWLKTAKTKIITPYRQPSGTWTPPPVVQDYDPPSSHEESNKKKDT